eukprot:CAMPEP_0119105690 /NCGR_PEP_ID=MMETSP1180-20130426/3590_1 /TAXON_ID=3052 ORGANISM="Chlamydomonas cf sp, Strain CCMP681" /NCGR_SAMPLE_ID=MMETSP1180 /ASSEMBLY_ACC=CAM_ASM_000741 /LENGTH=111 /DNA_ID=CAMNT_0007090813 /DNA_START=279 /DNA_END=614 /DNA_ORIENTATION=+
MTQVDRWTATGSDLAYFNSTKKTVQGLAYAAMACFGIEYITLFMGVTIFMTSLNGLNIMAHLVGLILIILLQTDNWSLNSFIAFFTVFNAAPAALELIVLFFIRKFSFVKY